jgi:hypothetical protein
VSLKCGSEEAKQVSEKLLFESYIRPIVLQGLKPEVPFMGFIGTTEVMP